MNTNLEDIDMMIYSAERLRSLIKADSIHRDVYLDSNIFQLEMSRIFGRTWIFVGHDSQVPSEGDFITTRIGLQPIVMVRGADSKVHVLYNRCGHRGAKVVNEEFGNAKRFRCMYHGWLYHTDGRLAAVPLPKDYPTNCDLKDPRFGMVPLARVENYRGFVFASLVGNGPELLDFLGKVKRAIDDIVDSSPDGAVEFVGGCHRYKYLGNWKHQLDNLTDTYHTVATHGSTIGPDGQQFHRRAGKEGGKAAFLDETGAPVILEVDVVTFPNGHSATQTLLPETPSGGDVDEYQSALINVRGKERAREILQQKYHNVTAYPSFDILFAQNAIRVILPVSVNQTEIRVFPMRLKGAPEKMFEEQVKYLNLTHSASSFVQSDDLEAFTRVQEGLIAQGSEWCLLARGLGTEKYSADGTGVGQRSSEVGQRHQYSTWLEMMIRD